LFERVEMEMESLPGSQLKPVDQDAQDRSGPKKGRWITLPVIAGADKIHLPSLLAPSDLSQLCRHEIVVSSSVCDLSIYMTMFVHTIIGTN
jgi:hypothetical protein